MLGLRIQPVIFNVRIVYAVFFSPVTPSSISMLMPRGAILLKNSTEV
jgi:hypothetical protein